MITTGPHVPAAQIPSSSTTALANWTPSGLVAGPFWQSFEQLRTSGSTILESIKPGTVGTLHSKSSLYRIMRDEDFQKLIGLASEVHRLKTGVSFVVQAAKVVAKHRDHESMELLFQSVSMLNESRVLPERDGHDPFGLTAEEMADADNSDSDEIELNDIPRPSLQPDLE